MLYVGVDHHKRSCRVLAMTERGEERACQQLPTEREALLGFLTQLGEPCQIALEAGRNWGLIYDWLQGQEPVAALHLAHPTRVKAIASAKIKTDTIDARTLAHLLRTDLLPTVHIPTRETRAIKQVLRQRIFWVESRTRLKNRIHDLADRHHLKTGEFSDLFGVGGRRFLHEQVEQLPYPEGELLRQDLEVLEELDRRIAETEGWLEELAEADEVVERLRSLPGIGAFLGLVVRYEIERIERFPSPKKLASYAGLVPSLYASGGRVRRGKITKAGNGWLRWALVEAVWPAVRKSFWLRGVYLRLKRHKGANKAKVAVARKLCELVWHVWQGERLYEERRPRVALNSP
jgi:transposase